MLTGNINLRARCVSLEVTTSPKGRLGRVNTRDKRRFGRRAEAITKSACRFVITCRDTGVSNDARVSRFNRTNFNRTRRVLANPKESGIAESREDPRDALNVGVM